MTCINVHTVHGAAGLMLLAQKNIVHTSRFYEMSSSVEDLERGVPLVPRPTDYRPEDDDRELQAIPDWTTKEILVSFLAGTTSLLSLVSMFSLPNPLVYLSSVMGIILPPYSAFLEQKITECEALKETNETMDRELNNLKYENDRLEIEVKKLEASVSHLKDMEHTLVTLRNMERISLDDLQTQLHQSQEILNQLEVSLVGVAIQNLLSVLTASDLNQDNTLQEDEVERMIRSLESIEGIQINKALFRGKIIERGRNLNAVVELIRDVLEEKDDKMKPVEDRIFIFEDTVSK